MTNDTIRTHIPMCLHCDEKEVVGNFTYENGDGFCSAECSNTAHEEMFAAHSISVESADEFYSGWTEDEADYMNHLCQMCRTHDAVEDGFCSFQCENLFYDRFKAAEGVSDQMYEDRYEDHMAQYDNDPSPYDGTYSEE